MSTDALSLIRDHLDRVVALGLADDGDLPEPPELDALSLEPGDLDRARALLGELAAAQERLAGMRVRVRGELEGMRRLRPEPAAPAPRVVDTAV